MHTLIILCNCLGLFLLYNTSKKAKLATRGKLEQWAQRSPKPARIAGLSLVLLSITALVVLQGWGVGLFAAVLLLMVSAGYTVAIAPLYYLRLKHVAMVVLGSLFLELFIF